MAEVDDLRQLLRACQEENQKVRESEGRRVPEEVRQLRIRADTLRDQRNELIRRATEVIKYEYPKGWETHPTEYGRLVWKRLMEAVNYQPQP